MAAADPQGGLAPGSSVGGYRIEQRIGRGGMAVVYRAVDDRAGRAVALKVLAPGLARDSSFRARFVRESRAAAAVRHRHVLPVYGAGEADGHLFIAMRHVRGGDVRQLLRRHGPLPPGIAWTVVAQVGSGLDAAHARGLVHRDVKPANMLLETPAWPAGAGPVHAYLADFGVSKQVLAERLTATGQIVGTLDYISPEQLEGQRLDGRADQYSQACAAFELLSGTPPFRRGQGEAIIYAHLSDPPPSLAARRPELPAAADDVLARALAKGSAGRFASCTEFAARLGRALGVVRAAAGRAAAPAVQPPGQPGAEPPTTRRLAHGRRSCLPDDQPLTAVLASF